MRTMVILVAATVLAAACGSSGDGAGPSPAGDEIAPPTEPVQPPADGAAEQQVGDATPRDVRPAVSAATPAVVQAVVPAAGPTLAVELEQPAVWPAADVVFATPEEAAADFVRELLIVDGEPALGEFQAGDSRSGEITVLFAGEDGALDPPMEKGVLALRQLGPDNGWFVLGASSEGAIITTPAALAEVSAGMLTVEGQARGLEGTVAVTAFPAGDDTPFDQQIGSGGAAADLEAYSVVLDLTDAVPGEVVAILVQGDTGRGSDPSTFAAIPVVIEDIIPPTR